MPTIILPGSIVLDPSHDGARQLQVYAQQLCLDRVQVFWVRLAGGEQTFLVVEWPRPVFKDVSFDRVKAYLDTMASDQHIEG
jgi:hypothetical protein